MAEIFGKKKKRFKVYFVLISKFVVIHLVTDHSRSQRSHPENAPNRKNECSPLVFYTFLFYSYYNDMFLTCFLLNIGLVGENSNL